MELLQAKTEDLFTKCERYSTAVFSEFLDGAELEYIKRNVPPPYGLTMRAFGGWNSAERCVVGVFPEWEEPEDAAYPIKCIRFTSHGSVKRLTHRDYLGALMSLGIERSRIGDILVTDDETYVLVHETVADYVIMNIQKIGNSGIKSEFCPLSDIADYEPPTEIMSAVVSSTRLDAFVAAAIKKSRTTAAELVRSGAVKVNHVPTESVSLSLKTGDLVSIRGAGRFVLDEIMGTTAKQRLHIGIKKFI